MVVPPALGLGLRLSLPILDHAVPVVSHCLSCQPSYTGLDPPDPDCTPDSTLGSITGLEVRRWDSRYHFVLLYDLAAFCMLRCCPLTSL